MRQIASAAQRTAVRQLRERPDRAGIDADGIDGNNGAVAPPSPPPRRSDGDPRHPRRLRPQPGAILCVLGPALGRGTGASDIDVVFPPPQWLGGGAGSTSAQAPSPQPSAKPGVVGAALRRGNVERSTARSATPGPPFHRPVARW